MTTENRFDRGYRRFNIVFQTAVTASIYFYLSSTALPQDASEIVREGAGHESASHSPTKRPGHEGDLANEAQPIKLPNGYREVGTNTQETLRNLCKATADTGLFSGSVLVAKKGQVIFKGGFGFANREWKIPNQPNTRFRLASVSKQFCSMLVMQLVQEGKLQLDDNICDHLHYYRKDTGQRITVHHLLSHQSGLKDFTSSFDYRATVSRTRYGKDEFIKLHCSSDLINDPGTIYSYCNAGYCILGRIIEKVTGKSFERNLKDRIFEPLEMKNSGFERNRYVIENRASGYRRGPFDVEHADYIEMSSTPGAAGALYSTVEDMFLWDRALYTDTLLGEKYRDLMFTPNRDVPEVKAAGGRPHSIYGYGWQITNRTHPITQRKVRLISHGGAINGFRAMESRLVDDDSFVMILCNLGDPYGGSDVWRAIVRLNTELINVVTNQPFRMPGAVRMTQEQRLYQMVQNEGVTAAIDWFREKGKPAAWGGSMSSIASQLLDDGQIEEALLLMEFDLEMTPNKVWLIRRTAQAFADAGRAEKALKYAQQGLAIKPKDEPLQFILQEAKSKIETNATKNPGTVN